MTLGSDNILKLFKWKLNSAIQMVQTPEDVEVLLGYITSFKIYVIGDEFMFVDESDESEKLFDPAGFLAENFLLKQPLEKMELDDNDDASPPPPPKTATSGKCYYIYVSYLLLFIY